MSIITDEITECGHLVLQFRLNDLKIKEYTQAMDKAFEIGIMWHHRWYEKKILELLKQQIEILGYAPQYFVTPLKKYPNESTGSKY